MSKFYPATSVETIKTGTAKSFKLQGKNILIANVDNEFFAIDDMCSHEDSPLSLGCLKNDLISCTLHGSRFNVRTGIPVEEPATEPVQTYVIRINKEMLEVEI